MTDIYDSMSQGYPLLFWDQFHFTSGLHSAVQQRFTTLYSNARNHVNTAILEDLYKHLILFSQFINFNVVLIQPIFYMLTLLFHWVKDLLYFLFYQNCLLLRGLSSCWGRSVRTNWFRHDIITNYKNVQTIGFVLIFAVKKAKEKQNGIFWESEGWWILYFQINVF